MPSRARSPTRRRIFKPRSGSPALARSRTDLGRFYQERTAADPKARGKALRTYQALVAIDPTNREGLYQLAFLQALAGQFPESRALLDRLPEDLRGRPQALAVLVADLAGQGDPQATRLQPRWRRTPSSRPSTCSPSFPRSIASKTMRYRDGCSRRSIGGAWRLRTCCRRSAASMRVTAAIGKPYRSRPAAASGVTVPLLLDLARAAFKGGDPKGALGYLAHARSLEPNNAGVHFMFGIICVELNLGAEV